MPGGRLTGWLNGNIHIVLCQQTQQLLVRSEVDLSSAAIVLHHLSGATVRRDQHTTDLVVLNRFNEVAVAHGSRFLLGVSTVEERWSNYHNRQHQQGR
ncbi:MAG: Uncharacterised protein [Synechococcus sp. CC9902]|nr:MAG: Uncharacterised protein [Synechococcus sp. CC9902]